MYLYFNVRGINYLFFFFKGFDDTGFSNSNTIKPITNLTTSITNLTSVIQPTTSSEVSVYTTVPRILETISGNKSTMISLFTSVKPTTVVPNENVTVSFLTTNHPQETTHNSTTEITTRITSTIGLSVATVHSSKTTTLELPIQPECWNKVPVRPLNGIFFKVCE